jgi:prepilin-type processing-associated H-X9-DG protein
MCWSLWPLALHAQPSGLAAYYRFDGNAVEATGSGLNGIVSGAGFSAGIAGLSLHIAKLGDHAQIPFSTAINLNQKNKTISVWFFGEEPLTAPASIIDKTSASDYALSLITTNGNHSLGLNVYDTQFREISTPVTLGQWHHAVIQKDGGLITLFLDGHVTGTTNVTSVRTLSLPLVVGSGGTPFSQQQTNWNFHGMIDELRFYNRTLSETEIRELYVQGTIVLSIEAFPLRVCWQSQTGQTYQVQFRPDLITNGWTDLGPPIAGDGSTLCVADDASNRRRFYRVVTLP